MSMDVYLWLSLYSLLTAQVWAGPLSTAFTALLTPYLANNVPTCAQPCLQSFVADSFPSSVCSSPSIDCLCTSDSETGYTIGEGALTCLVSDCPEWDQSEAVSAYAVCSNVNGATPNTHSTITATHTALTTVSGAAASTTPISDDSYHSSFSSTTLRHSSSISSSFSLSSSASSASSASTSAFSIDSTIMSATGSPSAPTTLPPSSSVIAAPASTSSSPPPTPVLTKPQIAGVVVASIGAAALAFGLCFLLFCYRRRRKQERPHSGSSFGGDKLASSSVDSSPDMAIIAARDFGHDPEGKEVVTQRRGQSPQLLSIGTPQTTGEEGWSHWRRNTAPQDIGLALAPGVSTPGHPSPVTPSSRRTRNSQLLPEKPSYSLFPPPLRPSPHSRRVSQSLEAQLASRGTPGKKPSPTTSSNLRFPSSLDTSQTYMQGDSNPRSPSSPPQIFPYMQAEQSQSGYRPYRYESTPDPTTGPHWSEDPGVLVRKPLPTHDPSVRGLRLGQSIHGQRPSVPRTHPQPPPIELHSVSATSTNTPRKKRFDPRPATWFSTGSETSFEDAEDIAEPVSAITPVKEQQSPITYPSIPLTAAESPAHRPKIPDRSDSLLARRRGEQRATEITDGINPRSAPRVVRHSAKRQILQSPVLSEPLATGSSSSNSPRVGRGADMTPPPSGWPGRKSFV